MKLYIRLFFLLLISLAGSMIQNTLQAQSSTSKTATDWVNGRKWANGLTLKPHETVNNAEFEKQYKAHQTWWDKGFAYLKETDLAALKPGKYLIDDENVFATVTEGPTKDTSQTRWESHKIYLDIHYVISGKEMLGIAPFSSATPVTDFDPVKDIGFYKAKGKYYPSREGTFFIIFPPEAHCGGNKVEGYDTVKKIVIKIRTVE